MRKILSLCIILVSIMCSCNNDDWDYETKIITPNTQAIDEYSQDEGHIGEYKVTINPTHTSLIYSGNGYYKKGQTATITFKGFNPDYGIKGTEFLRWIDLTNGETITTQPSFTTDVNKNRLFGAEVKVIRRKF